MLLIVIFRPEFNAPWAGRSLQTLHQQNVGFREPFQGGLQRCLFHSRDRPQQRIGKAAPDHRADLGHLAGRPEPVEPGRQRLLQRRRNRLDATPDFAAFQEKPRHLLDEQRYPARTLGDAIDHVLRQSMLGSDLADHMPHLMSVERHERDCAVMRARTPGRLELGPCGGEDEERCERAALGNAFQNIDCGRIGPMQILEGKHHRLNSRPREHPIVQRRQLTATEFLGRHPLELPSWRQWDIDQRRQQAARSPSDRYPTCCERAFEIGEAPLRRHIGATEALAAPLGNWMKGSVLQTAASWHHSTEV